MGFPEYLKVGRYVSEEDPRAFHTPSRHFSDTADEKDALDPDRAALLERCRSAGQRLCQARTAADRSRAVVGL